MTRDEARKRLTMVLRLLANTHPGTQESVNFSREIAALTFLIYHWTRLNNYGEL